MGVSRLRAGMGGAKSALPGARPPPTPVEQSRGHPPRSTKDAAARAASPWVAVARHDLTHGWPLSGLRPTGHGSPLATGRRSKEAASRRFLLAWARSPVACWQFLGGPWRATPWVDEDRSSEAGTGWVRGSWAHGACEVHHGMCSLAKARRVVRASRLPQTQPMGRQPTVARRKDRSGRPAFRLSERDRRGFRFAPSSPSGYTRCMSGFQRLTQVCWFGLTLVLVIWHCRSQEPFQNAKDAATLLGLVALAIRALIGVWRWADLAWRKAWLWLLNSSVNWTLQVSVTVPEPIENSDIERLLDALRRVRSSDRISRSTGSDTISVETSSHYTLLIRPLQSGTDTRWVLRFNPVHIGYRDATRIVQRTFVPVIDEVTKQIEAAGERHYSIEARFSKVNPYAAVLLNELRARSADRILLSFQQDGSTVQLTKDSIISSSHSESEAIHAMSTVFGLSLRGALSAGNV